MRSVMITISLTYLLLGWLLGCQTQSKQKDQQKKAIEQKQNFAYFNDDPFNSRLPLSQSLGAVNPYQLNNDLLWALAFCKQCNSFRTVYFKNIVEKHGVLPQALNPNVKEEIKKNQQLQLLFKLPAIFANTLAKFFANDEKINGEIRTNTDKKLAETLQSTNNLSTSVAFFFDLFPEPFQLNDKTSVPSGFNINDQATRWTLIFSADQMWLGQSPLYQNDHALQLLNTAIVLSEWQYLFGLKNSSEGLTYGGLTIDPRLNDNKLGKYDPRLQRNEKRVVSGTYSIQYPKATNVDLALKIREGWQRTPAAISLNEQAKLWIVSAMSFNRLRPEHREHIRGIFSGGLNIPQDTHKIGLIFLSAMDVLLKEQFINSTERLVKQNAFDDNRSSPLADLISSVRLAKSIYLWLKEIENLSQAGLSEEESFRLSKDQVNLKQALRLVIQNIILNFTETQALSEDLKIMTFKNISSDPRQALAEIAETLTTLIEIEQVTLPSPHFKEQLTALMHQFTKTYFADNSAFDAAGILWSYQAYSAFNKYPNVAQDAPWLSSAVEQLNKAISSWDQELTK